MGKRELPPPHTATSQFRNPCQPFLHFLSHVTVIAVIDFLVTSISEMQPVYNLDTKVITPHRATPIRPLKVTLDLSAVNCHSHLMTVKVELVRHCGLHSLSSSTMALSRESGKGSLPTLRWCDLDKLTSKMVDKVFS